MPQGRGIALYVGPDKRLMELEAVVVALRTSPGSSLGQGGGREASRGEGSGAPWFNQQPGQSQQNQGQSLELTHREKIRLRKNWIICRKCF